MIKIDILREVFDIERVSASLKNCQSFTSEELLHLICSKDYTLKTLGCSVSITTKWLKKCFPDRPSTSNRLDNFLLRKYGYKECKNCLLVLELDSSNFHKNSGTLDGFNAYCCTCQNKLTAVTSAERQAKYKASKLQRTPKWLTLEDYLEIEDYYNKCPKGCHVDHIFPLQGDLVSGLHVINNLQYLSAKDNMSKSNKYTPL